MFSPYIVVISLAVGLVLTKPTQKTLTSTDISSNLSTDEAFRQAEEVLHRYFYLIKTDADHLVHAMLSILLKNPTTFAHIPSRALDIALKNVAQKLGQNSVNTLTKPLILTVEQNALNKSLKPQSNFKLTDEVKTEIEEALDQFFQEQEHSSHM